MIVSPAEMTTAIDQYKLDEITDHSTEITTTCLRAAEQKVLSYLANRYDVLAIAGMTTSNPQVADLAEIIKDIALYYIIRRHNIDLVYSSVVAVYKEHLNYLEHIAKGTISLVGLPLRTQEDGKTTTATIAMGSRPKRDFEY